MYVLNDTFVINDRTYIPIFNKNFMNNYNSFKKFYVILIFSVKNIVYLSTYTYFVIKQCKNEKNIKVKIY